MRTKYETVEKTTSATFRMPDRVYNALQKKARENRTSLNTLVNQLLYAHFFDDTPSLRPMLVALPTPVFAGMLARLSDEDVAELAKLTAEGVVKSAVLGRYGEISAESIVDTFRITAQRAGYGVFSEILDEKETITFRHELGPKGSLFFAIVADATFRMAGIRPTIAKTDEAVIIQF
jgi:hypothetical protein